MIIFPLVSLGALAAASIASWFTRSPIAAIALAFVSGLWLVANKLLEGPVLVDVTPSHGLTATDLLGIVGYLYALRIVWGGHREGVQSRRRAWALMAVCTVAFVLWPALKLALWPSVATHFEWIQHLVG